jgi:hypothetical protein
MTKLNAYFWGRSPTTEQGASKIRMTSIDPRADILISYHGDDLMVMIPLADEVTEVWRRRYAALARAKDVRAEANNHDGTAFIRLAVPIRTENEDVLKILDAARSLIAETDTVEQATPSSNSPEAIARQWWARQRA